MWRTKIATWRKGCVDLAPASTKWLKITRLETTTAIRTPTPTAREVSWEICRDVLGHNEEFVGAIACVPHPRSGFSIEPTDTT